MVEKRGCRYGRYGLYVSDCVRGQTWEPDRSSETDTSCMEDFDATGDNSHTDSVAELEYNTWNDACTWEFRSASGNIPLGLIQNPPTELIQNTRRYTDDDESPEKFRHGGYVDGGIHPPQFCLGQQRSLWDSVIRNDDSMIIHRLYPKLTIYCHVADMD